MAKRVCSRPGCPTLVDVDAYRGLCDDHRKQRDRDRGTKAERGYGPEHDAERRRIQALMDAGLTIRCWRCHAALIGRNWHLDHADDRTGYRGPACPDCNLHLAGRARHGLERD